MPFSDSFMVACCEVVAFPSWGIGRAFTYAVEHRVVVALIRDAPRLASPQTGLDDFARMGNGPLGGGRPGDHVGAENELRMHDAG